MTEKFNTVKLYGLNPYHTQFGGYIYASDFNTDYRGKDNINGSSIANRIFCDQKFDEQCRKNIEGREKWREEKCLEKL